jgi:hypothetical protein
MECIENLQPPDTLVFDPTALYRNVKASILTYKIRNDKDQKTVSLKPRI